jgi:hypothetical protein
MTGAGPVSLNVTRPILTSALALALSALATLSSASNSRTRPRTRLQSMRLETSRADDKLASASSYRRWRIRTAPSPASA